MTRKGRWIAWLVRSIVTRYSCMISSRAACVLAGERLISSASNNCVNTGPGRKRNSCVFMSKIGAPVMSEGIKSAVNWMRPKLHPSTRPKARTNSVLPSPGTLSISTWPLENKATSVPKTNSSWPTKTFRNSVVIRSNRRPVGVLTGCGSGGPGAGGDGGDGSSLAAGSRGSSGMDGFGAQGSGLGGQERCVYRGWPCRRGSTPLLSLAGGRTSTPGSLALPNRRAPPPRGWPR